MNHKSLEGKVPKNSSVSVTYCLSLSLDRQIDVSPQEEVSEGNRPETDLDKESV